MRGFAKLLFPVLLGLCAAWQCHAVPLCIQQNNPPQKNYAPFNPVHVKPNTPAGTLLWDSGPITLQFTCNGTFGEPVNIVFAPVQLWTAVNVSMVINGKTYDTGVFGNQRHVIGTGSRIGLSGSVNVNVTYSLQVRLRTKLELTISYPNPLRVAQITDRGFFEQYIGDGNGIIITPETPSCNITAGDERKVVTLPPAKAAQFNGTGTTAGRVTFPLRVTGCKSSTKNALFRFTGKSDSALPTAFANSGAARNVAIQLGTYSGTSGQTTKIIQANGVNNNASIPVYGSGGAIQLFAEYIATARTVSPGTVSSFIAVRIDYD
ncbi:fimbrial protein [Burkholderia lata]|uniref:Fimbrial protein n=1 Tax=Burkholderia lata (strain ATCC 17760 / DSM 23089 / LMG 22485 / NCIMB 9086 / R18194 / 383) TaxID=482957 RepID=A0A6P2SVT2_BURL3|nr:fimbrial protein [Burkholderia lata]VWC53658.1 fimbrial protein [Burkholderia lata]